MILLFNLTDQSLLGRFQALIMLPIYTTNTEKSKPFEYLSFPPCNNLINMGFNGLPQFSDTRPVPNMFTRANFHLSPMGNLGSSSLESFNRVGNFGMNLKRQRGCEELAAGISEPMHFASVDGSGLSQFNPCGGFKVGDGLIDESHSQNLVDDDISYEKRHRRVIKNRESAARSRARRLAYNTQLQLEIEKVKRDNEILKRVYQEITCPLGISTSIKRRFMRSLSVPLQN